MVRAMASTWASMSSGRWMPQAIATATHSAVTSASTFATPSLAKS